MEGLVNALGCFVRAKQKKWNQSLGHTLVITFDFAILLQAQQKRMLMPMYRPEILAEAKADITIPQSLQ